MKGSSIALRRWVSAAIMLILVGQACTLSLFDTPTDNTETATSVPVGPTNTPYPAAQTTFVVTLPEPLLNGESLSLVVLDEVTGLPQTNSKPYPMSARDATTYTATLALPFNSVVKYRYLRSGSTGPMVEDTVLDAPIRYRLYYVEGPSEVQDIVASWSDRSYSRPKGTIEGKIYNSDTGTPLPNILVTAGGVQYITDSTGHFELTGLPTGTQTLTTYSLDGLYLPFQHGAVVGDGQSTSVDVPIKPTRLVNVTFYVTVPQDPTFTPPPVRIAGNILQLGNSFADLQGGVNVVPNRMPDMRLQPDGRYSYTVGLPVGTYIRYKYTLGDGYWNAERNLDGGWALREFIVPGQDVTLQDTVVSWSDSKNSGPILFEVSVPSTTLDEDVVYIQFKQSAWMEPLPMWPVGKDRWVYKLYGPLNFLGSFSYRFCRNGQCGSADDNQTVGMSPTGYTASTTVLGQDIQNSVGSWKWFENPETLPLVGYNITPRASGFMAGVEFQPTYQPNYSYFAQQAFSNIKEGIGSNLVVLTPTWSVTSVSPLKLASQPGQDPFWIDSAIMVQMARNVGLNAAIFPTPRFPQSNDTSVSASTKFWMDAPKDAIWWQSWFRQYHSFVLNYADLAAQSGAQTLIIGGDWVSPALPGGLMPDGSSSNVPADAEAQWRSILQDVRAHFSGQVFWAMPYQPSSFTTPVSFLRDMDGIYLLWSTTIATSPTATKTDYANEAGRLLDNEVAPMVSLLGKPVVLAVAYPSAGNAASGCISNGAGSCIDFNALSRPNADIPSVSLNLQTQSDIYEAMLIAVNARSWISGFVSRGYYMPVALQDKSTSIHGKPAATVLWYWFPRLLGIVR